MHHVDEAVNDQILYNNDYKNHTRTELIKLQLSSPLFSAANIETGKDFMKTSNM